MPAEEFSNFDETIYPGIGRRLLAVLIDGLPFFLLMFLFIYIDNFSRLNTVFTSITHSLLYFSYQVYFLNRFGATPGKMLLKIKVVKINGQKIGLKEAFLRCLVNMIMAIFSFAVSAFVILNMTEQQFDSMDFMKRSRWVLDNRPAWGKVLIWITRAWMWSDVIALFCNKKKRALHDFIAGTVVIYKHSL